MRLTDRHGERGMLDQLTNAVRAGGSRVLVVRGEPGVGKSALLDYLAGHALGCRVVRAAGVESEMELAFAGLHQLLAPMLDRLERLPVPQREALRTAFGLSVGPGTGRRRRRGRMKRSRRSWSVPLAGRRPEEDWRQRPRSWSGRRC